MGIPLYFKTISSKFPETIISDFAQVLARKSQSGQRVDNYLFFDLNCAIHPCCRNILKQYNETKVKDYLEYLIKEHKKRSPQIKVIDTYVGIKKELVQRGENRNYLYHINNPSKNVWTIILGKFSLAFSMAPEFFRRVYNRNPRKIFNVNYENNNSLISKTSWQEIAKK